MAGKTLFIAWQDKGASRQWFPIGRLDADVENEKYQFRYIGGAKRANNAGFPLLLEFPWLEKNYKSTKLFPTFANRVMSPSRPDFQSYLKSLALADDSDRIDMMAISGGRRLTDFYEVFPKITKKPNGDFATRFFLHGGRHVSQPAQERLESLKSAESLRLALEVNNPTGEPAVQIQTLDYQMIGWSPRYLAHDLAPALAQSPASSQAKVIQINPLPAPSEHRVLIELSGNLANHEPMSGPDFQPLTD